MEDEIRNLLERQAEWQKSRAKLSWAEKVRMVEAVRESVAALRRSWRPGVASQPEGKSSERSPTADSAKTVP